MNVIFWQRKIILKADMFVTSKYMSGWHIMSIIV